MIEESNGNNLLNVNNALAASPSNDDLSSQSLSISEYTDADESMSAPTEFLAEVCIIICYYIICIILVYVPTQI